jgi:hypothetical protein
MSLKRIVGLVLIIVGLVALLWGGVFWTRKKTVLDAGPVEIKTAHREGVSLPPIVGAIALIAGIVLLVVPERRGT